jgi:hypothetical protein
VGDQFTALTVFRQCPLVLLVKVGWRGSKAFESGEGGDEKWIKGRS